MMAFFVFLVRTVGNLSPSLGGRILSLFWFRVYKYKAHPKRLQWLAESKVISVFHRGQSLPVYIRTPNQVKGQVILLHGWSGRWDQMLTLAESFFAKNYEVITFDLPAHGENQGKDADIFELSEFLESVYRTLNLKTPVIVSHSAGFLVVCHGSLNRGIQFSKLVTINSPARFEYLIEVFREKVGFSKRIDSEIWSIVARRVGVKEPQIQLSTAHLSTFPAKDVLIINDRDDKEVVFSEGVQMKKIWPDARHILTQGLGHNRILSNQAVVEEILHFCWQDEVPRVSF